METFCLAHTSLNSNSPASYDRGMDVKVVMKKLGRSKAAGVAYCDDQTIVLDPRLSKHGGAKGYLGTCIHETIHLLSPDMTEEQVVEWEDTIADVLWKEGYRHITE